ncbi:MAG TPA: adenylate/guanylate cyclase domain-containing protein [Acidimicrobiales bacterium]
MTCGGCGSAVGDGAKFCAECGAKLPVDNADDVRKTVTALFCDLVGSTSLGERTDPESLRALLERYFAVMRTALERHGGKVEKFIGDAVVAFFGVAVTREDDALRAVRAALDMHRDLDELNPELVERWGVELAVRIGVNTGEVLVSGSADHTVGDAVNVAARLEQAAGVGEVLVGETTWRLVRDWAEAEPVAPLELKGKQEAVPAWRVVTVAGVTETPDADVTLRARLVGRDRELAILGQCFERAAVDRSCQLFTLFGAAGVGKTRLTGEFLASRTPGVGVIRSRCLSYGDGTSLWPLLEMLRASAGLTGTEDDDEGRKRMAAVFGNDADAAQVTELLAPFAGLGGTSGSIEEIQWAVRRYLEALAASNPVIWVIDDLHWAEATFLAIVEDVVDWSRDTALFVLCLTRPEFLDEYPTWGGGKLNVTNVLLKPLSTEESTKLVEEILGGTGLPAEALERVVSGAGGTPLFVEQLLAMLVDDGLLVHAPEGWQVSGDLGSVTVPPTIGALLAARLERLSAGERQVLDVAAVVGQLFYAGAVVELAAMDSHAVAGHLRSLARKEMVRSEHSDIAGEDGFAFTHILVRDSAYHALPKLRRADLHQRLARWLDKQASGKVSEADEFVGHHLAEAVALRRAMGEIDDGALAHEAARRLAEVALRLMATDPTSASALYARAADLVPGQVGGLELRRRHGVALFRAQAFTSARATLDGVLHDAEVCGDRGLILRARLAWLEVAAHTEGTLALAEIDATVAEALAYFESTGDDEGMAHAYVARRQRLNMDARWEPMMEICERIMHHASRCGDRFLVDEARSFRYAAIYYGPRPSDEGLELLRRDALSGETTRIAYGTRRMVEGVLLALRDKPGEARAALADSRSVFEEMHSKMHLYHLASCSANAELIIGDDEAAERHLLFLFEELEQSGERSFLSTVAPLLADIRLRRGDMEAATELAALGQSLTHDEDVVSQSLWRIVSAKIAATNGDLGRALVLAAEALEWIERSDQLQWIADIHKGRAEVQLLADRPDEARASLQRALQLLEIKGDIPDSRRVRRSLNALSSA